MAKDLSRYYRTEGKPNSVILYVRPQAKAKMDAYVRLVNSEVGWMGFIKTFERHDEEHNIQVPGLLVLEDVFLYEQEVSSTSVDAEGLDTSKVLQELIDDGRAENINELRFFAHSHSHMGVYHSGTDTGMIDDWAATGLEWFISHVQNKKGEIDARLDMFLPFRASAPVEEVVIVDQNLEEAVEKEIEEKVAEKKYKNWYKGKDNKTNTSGHSRTFREGSILSDERKEQQKNGIDGSTTLGTVEVPLIRYRDMTLHANGTKIQVRQEVVRGVIIHESIVDSPVAKERAKMTTAEKWRYYKEYMSDNPSLSDPTEEQLKNNSRSIQRSHQKKEEETSEEPSPGTSQKESTEDKSQTPTQKGRKNGSKKEKKDDVEETPTDSKKKEKESKEEKQQSLLSVKEESKDEVKEEQGSDTIEEDIEEAFKNLGLVS